MNALQKCSAALGTAALISIGLATPAPADVPPVIQVGNGSVTLTWITENYDDPNVPYDDYRAFFCSAATIALECIQDVALYIVTQPGIYTAGTIVSLDADPGFGPLPAGTYTVVVVNDSNDSQVDGVTGVSIFAETSPAPAPAMIELSLIPTSGSRCTLPTLSGLSGTWTSVPSASICVAPAGATNATLLGWATTADFPVAIAKRQVDNRWGAYELVNSAGVRQSVFIPIGRATLLSSPGKLYTVWSA